MPRHVKKLLLMKLMLVLSFAACIQVSARVTAQKVTLAERNATISSVFKKIEQQTGFSFIYDDPTLKNAVPVTIDLNDVSLEQALSAIFKNQPLSFKIFNKTIAIQPKPSQPPVSTSGDNKKNEENFPPPPVTVHGRVTNEKGEPIPGVTVTLKGTVNRTSTNDNGEFILNVTNSNGTLVFSAVTIETNEIKLNGKTIIVVTVTTKTSQLDEVVVNKGYYTEKQRLNTGNVSTVKAEDIQKQPVSNPLAALEGRIPGLMITQNSGVPGSSFKVQLRGQNSILSGNDPLYLIDGMPYTSQLLPNLNFVGQGGNPLNFINPSDIESIDVLKDADATAIYGSRGANGVVLITTRRGREGNTRVDLNIYSGIGNISRRVDYLNTQQYLQMRHEAFNNDGVMPNSANAPDLITWDTTRYTDWQKKLIGGSASITDAQASVSGGNTNTQYLIGGSYHRETTVFPGGLSDQKGNAHFNINSNSLNHKFRIQLVGNYLVDKNNLIYRDFTSSLASLAPDAPDIYNTDGSLNWANSTWSNPFAELVANYKARTTNLITNSVISYQLLRGLELKANLGYTNMQINEVQLYPISYSSPAQGITSGTSSFNTINIRSWIVEPQVTYKLISKRNSINALFGASIQNKTSEGQYLTATGFNNDALLENLQAASSIITNSITNSQYKYNAIFGRLSFNRDYKYLLNLTARRDGSSRFGPSNRFANFASVGVGWVFSNENYVRKNFSFFSFGKLRASYGTTGSDQINDYSYFDLYNSTSYPYQGIQGLYPSSLFNPYLQWEVNKKTEVGLDLAFLMDKIILSTSYYRNRSSNQLVNYQLSGVTGFTTISSNLPALVQNSGFEFSLSTTNIKTKNFLWVSSFNLTIPRNKLIDYPNLATSPYAATYVIGQPLSIRKVYHLIGVNDTTGIYQFSDSKGNPVYRPQNPMDKTSIINIDPELYGGLSNTFHYKGFELDIFFQFVKQTGRNFLYNTMPGSLGGANQPVTVLGRWKKQGDITSIQKFSQRFTNSFFGYINAIQSDQTYSDASFIRLKNLSISYHFPENWRQKMHLQNCRLYIQCQNLLTITNYLGYDPENQTNVHLPPLRVFTAGIAVTL